METIREAQLRRRAADRYPFIPVRMWTQAARIAELVRAHLERGGQRVRTQRRMLADQDFSFRGGFRQPPGAHTRMTDRESAVRHLCPQAQDEPPSAVTSRVRNVVPNDPAG